MRCNGDKLVFRTWFSIQRHLNFFGYQIKPGQDVNLARQILSVFWASGMDKSPSVSASTRLNPAAFRQTFAQLRFYLSAPY